MGETSFDDLVRVMAALRGPGGCPWDRQQTHESLRPYLLEEAYEVLDAVDAQDPQRLRDELGDLLLQVVFHARIAEEAGRFTIEDVISGIRDKLVRRHPHVFPDAQGRIAEGIDTPHKVKQRWEEIKKSERGEQTSVLDGVVSAVPALMWAQEIYRRVSQTGFEWPDARSALVKVDEELRELTEAVERHDASAVHEEVGDVLMTTVKVAAFVGVDAEQALRDTCAKFIRRFRSMENLAAQRGHRVEQMSLPDLEGLWREAKERAGSG
ncbi:MAG: nucleoside triphosphate pyrophosphohydrolase [Armatimonadota bacterium]|nr:nucleoside triphosphate pyrophosphohydrolase [Armatimonadota bacterium]MDR5697925.1 nucleoside triphosphate pyrophosphohydrolase [Armatimonadota bacterium]